MYLASVNSWQWTKWRILHMYL